MICHLQPSRPAVVERPRSPLGVKDMCNGLKRPLLGKSFDVKLEMI